VSATVWLWLALLVGAYLVGSVPWSWLVVHWALGVDVRRVGSGNVGATNAMRVAGRRAGLAALVLDILKGVVPVLVARRLEAPPLVVSCVAALAVLGHVYPVWLHFRGGKGVATAAGALGALAPLPGLLAVMLFVLTVSITRYVSLGSIVAVVSFPLFVLLLPSRLEPRKDASFLASSALVPALIVWKHRGNIARLLAGSERRLGQRAASEEEEGA